MKNTIISILLLLIAFNTTAQKQDLSFENAINTPYNYSGEYLNGLQWRGDNYTYINDWTSIAEGNIKNKSIKTLLTLRDLKEPFEKAGLTAPFYINSDYKWRNDNEIEIQHENAFVIFNCTTKQISSSIIYPKEAKNVEICSKANILSYTIDNNLHIADAQGQITTITDDKDKGIVNGDAYVHRQEFGIAHGSFWSPNGNFLAFYRKDETMVDNFPLVDMSTRIATVKEIKYPMAGETSEEVTIGVYNIKNKEIIFLETGKGKDQYLCSVTWGPNEKFIYIAVLNRDQNHLKLNCYDATSGKYTKTLFEEKHEKYVEPEHQLHFLQKQDNQFLWWSERDGYNHIYLYNTQGELIKQLTKGSFDVTDVIGLNDSETSMYYLSTEVSPLERHLYAVDLKSNKKQQLTSEKGVHQVAVNDKGTHFIDTYSSVDVPNIINLKTSKPRIVRNIITSADPFSKTKKGKIAILALKADDKKTDLYARLILPPDFDATKKYPAIVYVYGGPHSQQITDSWLAGVQLWQIYMAQQGYIMFTLDNRGSKNRGLEFENCIFRQLGQIEMQDQMTGVNYLKSLPFVDDNRLGVHGWSYGGFMTTGLMTHFPSTFKTGVAGGPVIDWKYYEVMYGERYMDTPQTNPEGYKKTSLIHHAKSLKGRLLIIHGAMDPVVVWQNSLAFVRECVKENIPLDYFPYPSHEHNVGGKDRYHLMKKITQYFEDFL